MRQISRAAFGVAIAMFICGFFVARVPDATRPEYAAASSVFVVLFALPSFVALWKWAGASVASRILLALGAFAFAIETFAIATGWPYGDFSYGEKIGAKLGLVPWTVPFAWTPLVLGAHVLTGRLRYFEGASWWLKVLQSTAALIAIDLVLDPGAVSQQFWKYRFPGIYYDVPLSNYFGWLVSGLIGVMMLRAFLGHKANDDAPVAMMTSVLWILSFWTSVCFFSNLWLPAFVGFILLGLIVAVARQAQNNSL